MIFTVGFTKLGMTKWSWGSHKVCDSGLVRLVIFINFVFDSGWICKLWLIVVLKPVIVMSGFEWSFRSEFGVNVS